MFKTPTPSLLRITIVFLLFLSQANAQTGDMPFQLDSLKKTDIEIIYGHYFQNGDHSAVTGGIGTERLTVYSSGVNLKRANKKNQEWSLKAGADVITSASTDNINFSVSSASLTDTRAYADIDFTKTINTENNLKLSAGTGLSVESDYLSVPLRLSLSFDSKNRLQSYFFDTQIFVDDLRWGRFDEDYYRPAKLVYPRELRDTAWHSKFVRQSYNFKFGFTQIVNQRMIIGIFPGIIHQRGLLATPFHRVYFTDGSKRVENLPDQRNKVLLGLKANVFLGDRFVLKNNIDFYKDNFDIDAIALENETVIKLNPYWSVAPFFRVYWQDAARYFSPYKTHELDARYYTSDYDLSPFKSYKTGFNIRFAPFSIKKKIAYNEFRLRYAYYWRSDGLKAHILSFSANGILYGKRL